MSAQPQSDRLDLPRYAFTLIKAHGGEQSAAAVAENLCFSSRVVDICRTKAVSAPGMTTPGSWGEPLVSASEAFVGSLRAFSPFDALTAIARQIPPRMALKIVSLGATGAEVIEAGLKPLSSLVVAADQSTWCKTLAMIVTNDELAKMTARAGVAILDDELRRAVATITNEKFLAGIINGLAAAGASSGTDAASLAADCAALLAAIDLSPDSRLRWIMSTDAARAIATMMSTNGPGPGAAVQSFPTMMPTGGVLFGIEVLVSDQVPATTNGSALILVDAAQLGLSAGTISIGASRNATLILDTDPVEGATAVVHSMYQENRTAIRAEREIGWARLDARAVAWLSDAAYGEAQS
jgi:HK97 family phage major capsid protein